MCMCVIFVGFCTSERPEVLGCPGVGHRGVSSLPWSWELSLVHPNSGHSLGFWVISTALFFLIGL